MEDDIDIYADLPTFDSKQDSDNKNDQSCNCTEIKKNFDLLMSKFEKLQKSNETLERNLSSLLKTAKLEIARKDKMIENLRKRLDDVTFKRNIKNESLVHSAHRSSYSQQQNYENVTLTYSNEFESEPQQTDLYHDRYESKKQNNDHSNQKLTLFGERLQKRIMENEKEEKKQLALSKCSIEPSVIDMSEENVIESDKENGSQSGVNNKNNELTVTTQNSNSETSRKKNSEKRKNSDDNMRETKRLKLDDNKEKTAFSETDNCITRYDLKDDLTEYETENNVDFDYRSDIGHPVRSKRYSTRSKIVSEHEDVKDDRDDATIIRNHSQKRREECNSVKDYNGRRFTESLKNFCTASTSNHVSERSNSYKKNGYRYTSPKRSRSRSRSDYETSSKHRSQERSKKSYRDSRYDDYRYSKYDNYKNRKYNDYKDSKYDDVQHKSDRVKRIHDIKENERSNRRCGSGERDLRNKLKTSASDVEDRESGSSYRDRKTYESRRTRRDTKVAGENASDNKRLDRNSKTKLTATKIDLRSSPGRAVAEDSEQQGANNESDTKAAESIEDTTKYTAENNSNLEEGEILNSPEKNSDSTNRTSEDFSSAKKNNVEIVISIGDKIEENLPVSIRETAIGFENNAINTEQVEKAADIKQDEAASRLLFAKDCAETTRSCSPIETNAVLLQTQSCENDVCKIYIDKDLNSDSTAHHVEVVASERVCDKNIDDDACRPCVDEKSPSSVVAKLADENKDVSNSNTESVNETEEIHNLVRKNIDKKKETNEFDDDRIHKLDVKEVTSCTTEIADQITALDKDKNQGSTESDVCHRTSEDKSNIEMSHSCLRDHNYVQNSVTFDHNVPSVQQTSSVRTECNNDTSETTVKKTNAAKETVNVRSNGVKKTSLSVTKSKKDQQSTGVIISRRRRAVTLSDNNASMTILKNTTVEKTSPVVNESSESALKPRACKASRSSKVIM
ncbi:CASP8-associated protein 2-like isoform X1 [Pseudomyrmex gracilis]|uniref:CASP8-associated protein 2-like isoform X1 n=1 Tax=Pseudomyrmex gracilis TaxID=219809 RepID=UPI000995B45A|nr:CASP8-associated protein 2-like isoform X1 [Pseudomyrmex gracilis]